MALEVCLLQNEVRLSYDPGCASLRLDKSAQFLNRYIQVQVHITLGHDVVVRPRNTQASLRNRLCSYSVGTAYLNGEILKHTTLSVKHNQPLSPGTLVK